MNIHSGVFRPRLISRKIDEESRTFLPEETPPTTTTRTSHSLGMLAEWPKFISQKKRKGRKKKVTWDGSVFKLDVQTGFLLAHI